MPVSESEIRNLMRECGVTLTPSFGGIMAFVIEAQGKKLVVTINITKNEIVQFRTLEMMTVKPAQHRPALYTAMMSANYQKKVVKFAFDRSNGAVVAYIDIYVGDSSITKQQVQRCVNAFRNIVIPTWKRFETVAETGTDPGDAASPQITDLISELLAASNTSDAKKAGLPGKKKAGNFDDLLGQVIGDED